jgi:hypothetical protein
LCVFGNAVHLYVVGSHIYNKEDGKCKYCCVANTRLVTRTRHNVMPCINYLSCYTTQCKRNGPLHSQTTDTFSRLLPHLHGQHNIVVRSTCCSRTTVWRVKQYTKLQPKIVPRGSPSTQPQYRMQYRYQRFSDHTFPISPSTHLKGKVSPLQAYVAQSVGRGIALLFHDCGTRRGWVVSSRLRPHSTPGKQPVPILQEAGWAPGPVWTGEISRPHRVFFISWSFIFRSSLLHGYL